MSFRLQRVDAPYQPPVLLRRLLQSALDSLVHPAQQRQELAVQPTHVSLAYLYSPLIQHLLDLDELLMLVFVLPAYERQHIQPIRALG